MRTRSDLTTAGDRGAPGGAVLEAALSLLAHAPFGVMAVSREGQVLSMNPAACRLLGYPSGEVEGEASARVFRAPSSV